MSDFLSAGRLEDHPFAELSGLIFQQSRTGELSLESGNRRRSVWFLGGNPVAVVSSDPQDHLAQFLLEHGKIGDDDARRLADLPETREALGSTDFLPKETLNWGVKSRFVNLCYDLFRWEDGDYAFIDGEAPRELFLLKVPAHSLILKGVGLLGQATVFDAVPDDAVCGAGPVAAADARYLTPEALALLGECRPGSTVADTLDAGSADRDQARRLLYALKCLGLISLSPGRPVAASALPAQDEGPGFILDGDGDATYAPAPAQAEQEEHLERAGAALERDPASGEFTLDLPPLGAEFGSSPEPASEPAPPGAAQAPGSYPFEDDAGSFGSFGSFETDAGDAETDEAGEPAKAGPKAAKTPSTRSGSRFHVPRMAGIALGAVAAAGIIGIAGWWWMSEGEPPPPPVKPPVRRPAPAAVAPTTPAPAPAPVPAAQAVSPAPPPALQAPTAAAPAPAPPAVAPPRAAAVVPPAAPAPAPAAGGGGADRYRNGLEIFRAGDLDGAASVWESLLSQQHRGAFTVQLLTACQPDTIRDAQRSFPSQEIYLVTKKVAGRVCYRICLGAFDTRDAAVRTLAGLPATYRNGGSAVRPVADVLDRDR